MLRGFRLSSRQDVTILGAGVIGLSLALELRRRGARVTLIERRAAATQASWAAAGMLAAQDPFNPPQLAKLARLSAALYPVYLHELSDLSGLEVPFQTHATLQHMPDGTVRSFAERSLDPRQLAVALLTAVQRTGIRLLQHRAPVPTIRPAAASAAVVVHTTGAWAAAPGIVPRKGQMLRVKLPAGSRLRQVYRSEQVYVVPRTQGPQAGTALIGATVEDAGFDTETVPEDLAALRQLGARLVPSDPALADPQLTPMVEAWAGLRPATPDGLPLLGTLPQPAGDASPPHFIAAGHFRNGILLAPATAILMADLIENHVPALDLTPFAPARFTRSAIPVP